MVKPLKGRVLWVMTKKPNCGNFHNLFPFLLYWRSPQEPHHPQQVKKKLILLISSRKCTPHYSLAFCSNDPFKQTYKPLTLKETLQKNIINQCRWLLSPYVLESTHWPQVSKTSKYRLTFPLNRPKKYLTIWYFFRATCPDRKY